MNRLGTIHEACVNDFVIGNVYRLDRLISFKNIVIFQYVKSFY
jgi:hypothetical protein